MSSQQSIRGMHDILPEDSRSWQRLEDQVAALFRQYQFKEIRTPMVEQTAVFTRAIGQATDVVEKEMYTFIDRNGDSLSLRPEGTAGVVRSVVQHGLTQTPGLKVWYRGPMFRHERPQKGRQRQFHQFGAEVFGLAEPASDVELIVLVERLWQRLGIRSRLRLEINSLGDASDRARYRAELLAYLADYEDDLDDDSKRRMQTNPLRIFDSKVEQTQRIMRGAPQFADVLGDEAKSHFSAVCEMLDELGVSYSINPALVRGLDYYCRTVFEWVTDELGAQGTVCAGGRYDGLVALAGGKDIPGIGFAMGVERLLSLLGPDPMPVDLKEQGVYWTGQVETALLMTQAERLRDQLPALSMGVDLVGGSLKAQLKRANRSGAKWAVILGPNEWDEGIVQVKDLRSEASQERVALDNLAQYFVEQFKT